MITEEEFLKLPIGSWWIESNDLSDPSIGIITNNIVYPVLIIDRKSGNRYWRYSMAAYFFTYGDLYISTKQAISMGKRETLECIYSELKPLFPYILPLPDSFYKGSFLKTKTMFEILEREESIVLKTKKFIIEQYFNKNINSLFTKYEELCM